MCPLLGDLPFALQIDVRRTFILTLYSRMPKTVFSFPSLQICLLRGLLRRPLEEFVATRIAPQLRVDNTSAVTCFEDYLGPPQKKPLGSATYVTGAFIRTYGVLKGVSGDVLPIVFGTTNQNNHVITRRKWSKNVKVCVPADTWGIHDCAEGCISQFPLLPEP